MSAPERGRAAGASGSQAVSSRTSRAADRRRAHGRRGRRAGRVRRAHNRSRAADRDAQQTQRAASDADGLAARRAREARPIHGRGPAALEPHARAALRDRRALVAGLEAAVAADARKRAQRGEHDRRYRSARCFTFRGGVDDPSPAEDLSRVVAIVECIAVTAEVAPDSRTTTGSLIGEPYRARVDFRGGRHALCKIVQQPGGLAIKRRHALVVPAACGGKG